MNQKVFFISAFILTTLAAQTVQSAHKDLFTNAQGPSIANYCENMLRMTDVFTAPGTEQTLVRRMDIMSAKLVENVSHDQSQLTMDQRFREYKDPRGLFRKIFTKNPVDTYLNTRVQAGGELLQMLSDFRKLIINIFSIGGTPFRTNPVAQGNVLHAINVVLNEIQIEMDEAFPADKKPKLHTVGDYKNQIEYAAIQDGVRESLETVTNLLIGDLNNPDTQFKLHAFLENIFIDKTADISTYDGDEDYENYRADIQSLSVRYGVNASVITAMIDKAVELTETDHRDSVDIGIAINIAHTTLRHNENIENVVRKFLEIDNLGEKTKHGYHIVDEEVTALLEIKYELNITSSDLMKRYFEIEEMGRTTKDNFHLNDQSITYLTFMSLKHQVTIERLKEVFFKIHDKTNTLAIIDGFNFNDLATAILAGEVFSRNISEEIALNRFFDLYNKLDSAGLAEDLSDENLSRLLAFTFSFQLNSDVLVEYLQKADRLDGVSDRLDLTRALTILSLALRSARQQGITKLEDVNFREASKLAFLRLDDAMLNLTDSESYHVNKNAEITYGNHYDDEDDNGGGGGGNGSSFRMTLDSDGIHPNMTIGSGMGIDLTDGSITVDLGGGMTLDTDGDGIGFKF